MTDGVFITFCLYAILQEASSNAAQAVFWVLTSQISKLSFIRLMDPYLIQEGNFP